MVITVLLTSFNRKQKTIECLKSLGEQRLPEGVSLRIMLTDDASTDGTPEAIRAYFPEVTIVKGTGNLYWAGGMRAAWRQALFYPADYFLLLNDDTILFPHAISFLLKTSTDTPAGPAVAIGSTCDDNGIISYGGWRLHSSIFWSCTRSHSNDHVTKCDLASGNILLVPEGVVKKIGILADHFTHTLADFDFTLKASRAGFDLKVAPGFLGQCINDHDEIWLPKRSTLKERVCYLKSPKGLAYREHMKFIKEHFPLSYLSQFFRLWIRTLFPILWYKGKAIINRYQGPVRDNVGLKRLPR